MRFWKIAPGAIVMLAGVAGATTLALAASKPATQPAARPVAGAETSAYRTKNPGRKVTRQIVNPDGSLSTRTEPASTIRTRTKEDGTFELVVEPGNDLNLSAYGSGGGGACVAREDNPPPTTATSRTDPFLRLLRDRLDIRPKDRLEMLASAVDWPALRAEAQKATDEAGRAQRLAYVEFWQRLAQAHDYGLMCSRMNVFEWKVCQLLTGTHVPEPNALAFRDLGMPRQVACEYLLTEQLPAWGSSLRLCAAGVLAGDGDRRGMDILLEAIRQCLKPKAPVSPGLFAVHEAARAAWTEASLPLWREASRDPDGKLRLLILQNVAAIRAGQAVDLLLELGRDPLPEVRDAAAVALMRRDVKEAAPVLLESVRRRLDGGIVSAHDSAPLCTKLAQWGVPGVPWEKIEAVLVDQVRAKDSDHWLAVEIAGHCLSAGRREVALPFLKATLAAGGQHLDRLPDVGGMRGKELAIPWRAATILASHGQAEGVDWVRRYMEVGAGNWTVAREGLMALAEWINRPGVTPDDRKAAVAIAAQAVERRNALFLGYFWRELEALAEMGALVRVRMHEGQPVASETLDLPYERKYGPHGVGGVYMLAELYRARLRSVEVAARQEGVTLPPGWLSQYGQSQRAIIAGLAAGPDNDLRLAAEHALKEIPQTPAAGATMPSTRSAANAPISR